MKKYRFALMSFVFVALAAYALTPATQWGDVSPTNTLARVAADAGLATSNAVNAKLDKTDGTARGLTITPRLDIEDDDSWCTIRWSLRGWYLETDESADRLYLPTGDGIFALTCDIASATNALALTGKAAVSAALSAATNYIAAAVGGRLDGDSIHIGLNSSTGNAQYATAVGQNAFSEYNGVAVGSTAKADSGETVAVGADTVAAEWGSVAFGKGAESRAAGAIQIGRGTNSSNNTFKVFNTMLLDASGHVPLLTGKSYDLSLSSHVTQALEDIITALGGTVE